MSLKASGMGQAGAGEIQAWRRRSSPWYIEAFWRIVKEKPLGAFGGALILVMVLVAIFAPLLAPYPYAEVHEGDRLAPPSASYLLGTDNFGRDMLSRIVYGARISIYVAVGAVLIGSMAAATIGVTTGYLGGTFDKVVQRFVDIWMSFPNFVLLLTIMAVLGPSLNNVVLALSLWGVGSSRIIRGAVLSAKQNQYIEAAVAMGCGRVRIILVHILPNVFAPILIIATVHLGSVILSEASLSFLGFGVPPPFPAWGQMLSGASRTYMISAPWMAIFPGLAISAAIFGFNMFGDALRDVLDPRLRGPGGR